MLVPGFRITAEGDNVTLSTGIYRGVMVSSQVADWSPLEAVIVAVPAATAVTTPVSLTVALVSSEEVQVTVGSVAFSGRTVAVRVNTSPSIMVWDSGVTVMEVTGKTSAATVTAQVAVKLPSVVVTVMVAVPTATAVTLPSASTVATVSSSEVQVTLLSVASSGRTVAVRVAVPPSTSERVAGARVTSVTATGSSGSGPGPGPGSVCSTTVTGQEANCPSTEAVMAEVPTAMATTVPSAVTCATPGLEDVHSTCRPDALAGSMVAVSDSVPPTSSSIASLSRVIEVTCPLMGTTETMQEADTRSAVAVMTADPSALAITNPSWTVATLGSDDVQVTVGFVALDGSTIAVSVSMSPTCIVTVVLLRVTESTSISGGRQEWNTSPTLRIATIIAMNFFILLTF